MKFIIIIYTTNKDNVSWLDYASQRNKVKNIIRNDLIEEQNTIGRVSKQMIIYPLSTFTHDFPYFR